MDVFPDGPLFMLSSHGPISILDANIEKLLKNLPKCEKNIFIIKMIHLLGDTINNKLDMFKKAIR
tara:strand:- start:100 stop:294 length:195 start_codon:yes stop_codon:yes gene_type:complete